MTDRNHPTGRRVARAPADVAAPLTDPRGARKGAVTGPRDQLTGESTNREHDVRLAPRVTAQIKGGTAMWSVVEVGPTFTEPPDPWVGVSIVFEITKSVGDTQVRWAHEGIGPEVQCDGACSGKRRLSRATVCTQFIATPEEMS